MPCGAKEAGGVYRPRHPQQSPLYQLVERFYPEFEALDEERYQDRYGFWRDRRFQPRWPADRPCWRLGPPFGGWWAATHQPQRPTKHIAEDISAPFRLEWPHRARHIPATSKKEMPIRCSHWR